LDIEISPFLLFYLRFLSVLKHLTVFYNKQKRNLIENLAFFIDNLASIWYFYEKGVLT